MHAPPFVCGLQSYHVLSTGVMGRVCGAAPRPVSRSELCSKIWGDEPTESDALRSHLYLLRKTLQQHGAAAVLETVHGVGFVIKAGAN